MKFYFGLLFFYIDFDCGKIEVNLILKMGCKVVECNMLFIDGFEVLKEYFIGEEGVGFKYLL